MLREIQITQDKFNFSNCWHIETEKNAASDQGLHCLPVIDQFSDTSAGSNFCSNFRTSMVRN